MKNTWKYILIGIGIILLFLLFKWIYKTDRKVVYFKKVEFNSNNKIFNRTTQNYLDTIVYVGLNEMGIEKSTVLIYPLTDNIKETFPQEYTLKAFIKGVGSTYIIWIDDMNKFEAIQVLSHELVHLKQYYDKRLLYSDDPYVVIWENKSIDIRDINYEQRPWEVEAFQKEIGMEKKILKNLF